MTEGERFVAFADEKVKEAYELLKKENPELFKFIERAIDDLKKDPYCGIAIQKRLIPKIYIKKYNIDNLWKYDLPGAWRLLYSVISDRIKIISIILEWMDHKQYERRFGY
jgi:Txe/YoeB family toxin of Txe-Axe toxin-antitoxin module